MADTLRRAGAGWGILRFYRDPRGSMRSMLDSRPGEGRLFAYAIGAGTILLSGRVLALATAGGQTADLAGRIAAEAAALFFFVPLAWYALAAFGTMIARSFKGAGGWREGRAAFFWAALMSSPLMALSGLVPVAAPGAPGSGLALLAQAGPVVFAWALAQCYAEAFGFRRASTVLAVIAGIVLGMVGLVWWAQS